MGGDGLTVLFTEPEPTLAALMTARRMSHSNSEPVKLLVALLVPYPLPLMKPPVSLGLVEERIRQLAEQSGLATRIELCLCRDIRDALRDLVEPGSMVVIGTASHRWQWWRGQEERLASWLRDRGYVVMLAPLRKERHSRAPFENALQFRMPNSGH